MIMRVNKIGEFSGFGSKFKYLISIDTTDSNLLLEESTAFIDKFFAEKYAVEIPLGVKEDIVKNAVSHFSGFLSGTDWRRIYVRLDYSDLFWLEGELIAPKE